MRRLAVTITLLCGIAAVAFSQNYNFDSFLPLFQEGDNEGMKKMLDQWDPKNADYFAASFEYWAQIAKTPEDVIKAFESATEGCANYPDRLDLMFDAVYGLLLMEDYSAATSWLDLILSTHSENGGQWLMINEAPVEDSRNAILSGIDKYLSAMRELDSPDQVDLWMDRTCVKYPLFKNGLLIIKERWLVSEWKQNEARDILKSILDEDPDYRAALLDLADLSYSCNDYDSAIDCLERLIELDPDENLIKNLEICKKNKDAEYSVPDLEGLKRLVENDRPQYDALLARFQADDPTLSEEEIRTVYYGYAFTDAYNPLFTEYSKVNDLMNEGDLDAAKSTAESLLKDYPVCMSLLRQLAIIANKQGVEDQVVLNRYVKLIGAIMSTGNGRSIDKSFYVISVPDIYEILRDVIGIQGLASQEALSKDGRQYDCMNVLDYSGQAQSVYFNVDLPYYGYDRLLR